MGTRLSWGFPAQFPHQLSDPMEVLSCQGRVPVLLHHMLEAGQTRPEAACLDMAGVLTPNQELLEQVACQELVQARNPVSSDAGDIPDKPAQQISNRLLRDGAGLARKLNIAGGVRRRLRPVPRSACVRADPFAKGGFHRANAPGTPAWAPWPASPVSAEPSAATSTF
jgi:hypothetical protein